MVTVHYRGCLLPRHGTVCHCLSEVLQHCKVFVENSRRFCFSRVLTDFITSVESLAYRTNCISSRHFFSDCVQCTCNLVKRHSNQFLFNNNNDDYDDNYHHHHAGLAESNGSLPLGGWLKVTCRLTACTPGSVLGTTLDNEYGKTLPYLTAVYGVDETHR